MQLTVQLEESAAAVPGTYERSDEEIVLAMRLGERTVRARVEAFGLDSIQTGNGAVFSIDMVSVPAGTLVVTHHNLDAFVDPPRFSRSRWSEGWWLPADMQSGGMAIAMDALGRQHVHGAPQADGSICISDALGDVERYVVSGSTLGRSDDSDSCERLVAEQPEPVFHRVGTRWETRDDYLRIHRERRVAPNLYELQVAWSDGGQYEEGEDVPEFRSTRLVWADDTARVHWCYLNTRAFCSVRRSGNEIACGDRRFRFETGRLVVLAASSH